MSWKQLELNRYGFLCYNMFCFFNFKNICSFLGKLNQQFPLRYCVCCVKSQSLIGSFDFNFFNHNQVSSFDNSSGILLPL